MKPAQAKAIYQDCKKRGYVEKDNVLYPPGHPEIPALAKPEGRSGTKHVKTGWVDDTRNIANKEKQKDIFITLVKQLLGLEVWPEFYFSTERGYRFDYAIPVCKENLLTGVKSSNSTTLINPNSVQLKIAIEVEGGIWAKGNSGHSSGTGIKRDMDKSSLANVNGWTLIRRVPDELCTMETIELIKKAISLA
ncbi:hypothetical protein [Mucilaginibacter gynuensis]